MDFIQVLQTWGWAGVLVLFMIDKVWPFFATTFFPARAKREEEERKWQHTLEERRVTAMESMANTVGDALREMSHAVQEGNSNITMAMTVQNERVMQLNDSMRKHDSFTVQAVGDMRTQVAVMRESGSKITAMEDPETRSRKRWPRDTKNPR
jgi:hypothetical protein